MLRNTIALGIAAILAVALTADRAEAWGGCRFGGFHYGGYGGGYSHYSYGGYHGGYGGGVYHSGSTSYSPYSGISHSGTTAWRTPYGGGATYHSGYSSYHPDYYGGAYGGGIRYGSGTGHVQSGVPFTTVY
jgi:hypothetical protein